MELRQGFPLLIQQYRALFMKNLLLSWRHVAATIMQLFSSLIFIFLIFCIQKATQSQSTKGFSDPEPLVNPPIPPCEDKFFVKTPCFDFVWSGNKSPRASKIVENIMNNNPGRKIPVEKVKSFNTKQEVDEWLFNNPKQCPAALHLNDRTSSSISYGLQTNSTAVSRRGRFEDPVFKFQVPLQIAAEREIARTLLGEPKFNWDVTLRGYALPSGPDFSTLATIGPTFFLAICMFGFVFQISSLIAEKELKLRQAMTMMGLFDTAYWFSWLTWEVIIGSLSALFTVLFGMIFQLEFFIHNSFAVVYLLFLLFQINMVGYGFMLSAFISKSSSATTVGFSIFIVSFLAQLITSSGFPYNSDFGNTIKVLWSLFPPNLLTKGIIFLANATSNPKATPITWSDIGKCAPNEDNCYLTMLGIYKWLGFSFIAWFLLAIYLDNIFLNSAGVRKPVYYFLNPGYWTGRGGNKVKEARLCSCCCTKAITPFDPITPDDQDVLEVENLVKKQAIEDIVDPNTAVQIRGLVKIYPGKTKVGCCKCKTSPGFQAVKGTWLNFQKDQLFCLLGPNGAGKTTTISCLTGTAPVTAGEALIYGHSIRSSVGMANIRKIIGVCPQFDILWEALSGTEHLHLFASIKGLHPSTIKEVAEKSLAEVRLTEASQRRAGSYSGGMKRRLSVAIALIGDPKLVILDEPTTGMDPVTRRHVWDIIENAKKGRAIILTTHSMEEADILSDRIGIMAKGRLRCIGTSIRLKSRFGAGFIANVSFSGGDGVNSKSHGAVKRFFKDHLNVMPTEENKSFLTYVIPHDREKQLTNFFAELQDRQNEFGVSDIQLGLTTLEEVFMNIARQAELETAQAEGTMAILTLTSGHELQIPLGARFIGIPGTGHMVEVYWEQDDTGGLCISGHSPEAAIPPHVHVHAPPFAGKGEAGPPLGLVIDPSQVGAMH